MQTFGFHFFTRKIIGHMKNLNKNYFLFLIIVCPLALLAQPSEYVQDVKTRPVLPTAQKKGEVTVQNPVMPAPQPAAEVSAKGNPEKAVAPATPQYQPYIVPAENTPLDISPKSLVEPVEEVLAVMRFEKKTFQFGTIKMGEHPSHIFSYTNTGQEPVEIEIVSACDCTDVEYTKNPIAVGGTASIKATYMSERAPENVNKEFEKEITIVLKNKYPDTGYPMVETLKIKGNVVE
jgi:Protein of unknown function (DUF1573)